MRRSSAPYGPDTYAVAKCLSEDAIVGELPKFDGRYPGQPVFIAVIKTNISNPGGSVNRETRGISPDPEVCHAELWEMDGQHRWVALEQCEINQNIGSIGKMII